MHAPLQQHQQQGGGQKGKPGRAQQSILRHEQGRGIMGGSKYMSPPGPCPILTEGALSIHGMASLCAFSGFPARRSPTFWATSWACFWSLGTWTHFSSASPQPMVKISLWAVLCRKSFTWICFFSLSTPGRPARKSVFGPCMNEGIKTSKSMEETAPSLTARLPFSRMGASASTEPLTTSMFIFLSWSIAIFCCFAGKPGSTSPLRLTITTFVLGCWRRMSPAISRPMTPPPETTTVLAFRIAPPAFLISSFRCCSVCPGVGEKRGHFCPVATTRTE
mmetsp:Transcript_78423/g.205819  ORF Transcript_78423/g.205819 Transcript_78423/m.205819 type:complete len:277 (+) Transcript_78423:175-1005(+)